MMEALWKVVVDFATWFLDLVKAVGKAFWDFCVDVLCYLFDKVLGVAVDLVKAIDVSGVDASSTWASIPADALNVMGLCGMGQCMAIIGAAIMVRLTMQLIPFVRLGS